MTPKGVFLKLLILAIILVVVFIGLFFFVLRTKSKDLSDKFPYSKIVGKEITTRHICYIALNHKPFVLENPYILEMNRANFYGSIDTIYLLPVGTTLKIDKTRAFTKGVSGSTHHVVLGSVFIKGLDKMVSFEFYWGNNPTFGLYGKEEDYDIYPLAPWQETALPFKYFRDGRKEHQDWETWNAQVE